MKVKFKVTQMNLDENMTKTKIVGLNEFYNFVVYNFWFEIIYSPKILYKVLIYRSFHKSYEQR